VGSSTRYGSVEPIASLTQPCCERTNTSWTPTAALIQRSWWMFCAGSRLASPEWRAPPPWKERFGRPRRCRARRCRRAQPGCMSSARYAAPGRFELRRGDAGRGFLSLGLEDNRARVRASAMRGRHRSVPFESGNDMRQALKPELGAPAQARRSLASALDGARASIAGSCPDVAGPQAGWISRIPRRRRT
jgi:hypothetical protein